MFCKINSALLIMIALLTLGFFVAITKADYVSVGVIADPYTMADTWVNGTTASASLGGTAAGGLNAASDTGGWLATVANWAKAQMAPMLLLTAKGLALFAIQQSVAAMVGDGPGGNSAIIHDFNNYLYVAPQQAAMAKMNSFFTTVSQGRLSSLNYEGVGPNYDAYLVGQAKAAINGQTFQTNLQNYTTDPSQLFSSGNMKGIMSYMQCANNVACYTLTTTAQYNAELAKAQDIAKTENVNGFMPKKTNGVITQPASLAQSALTQIDQLGTQVLMNAALTPTAPDQGLPTAISQVGEGAAMTVAARLANYSISDAAGKAAIINKNNQFPFSLSYSNNGGVGMAATGGGGTVSTGIGANAASVQIGNTCATGGYTVNKSGVAVLINGQKQTCTP